MMHKRLSDSTLDSLIFVLYRDVRVYIPLFHID